MESNLLLICKALFLLIAAHPILSVLRMTYAFITRSMFKKLYWAIPVSLLALLLEEFHFLAFNFRK